MRSGSRLSHTALSIGGASRPSRHPGERQYSEGFNTPLRVQTAPNTPSGNSSLDNERGCGLSLPRTRIVSAEGGPGTHGARLLFVVLHFDRFQVFGFKYLTAIQTFEIIDAIPAGNNLGTGVIASGRHIQRLDEVYFKRAGALVKPFYTPLQPGIQSRVPKAAPDSILEGMGGSRFRWKASEPSGAIPRLPVSPPSAE
jgi:hypothetical protein